LAAFGGGFTWGSIYLKWAYDKNKFKLKQIIMDLKEIQNLIKFVANSGVAEVKLEMDDVKITIRTTLEEPTETTYVQQMPSQTPFQQAIAPQPVLPVASAQPVAVVRIQNTSL
jgi:hypothetical protein